MFKKIFILSACFISFALVSTVYAQGKKIQQPKHVIYEIPTLKTLSQLYWALHKLEANNDEHVDNFLMINECDLYSDYAQNEFEWNGIRESARTFLLENRKEFPTHFELLQPLRMAEYEIENGKFDVWKPYKIDAIRRFEVLAEDLFQDVCGKPYGRRIGGYPKGLFVELNRPFTLDKIPVAPEIAEQYIRKHLEKNEKTGINIRSKDELYDTRDAYLVMKMRIFSFQEDVQKHEHELAKVLAVLESFEIYGDRKREMLLFSENFKRKKDRSKMEIEMKKRYQERLKRQMEAKKKAAMQDSSSAEEGEATAP